MARTSDILGVTEKLYAAAGEPEYWEAALEALTDLVDADHTTLDVHGTAQLGTGFVARSRVDEGKLAQFLTPDALRLLVPMAASVPVGVSTRREIIPDAEFERSTVYNELLRPLNGFHSVQLRRNGTSSAFLLCVCRPRIAENFDQAHIAVMRALAPHLTTALALQQRLRTADGERAALGRALDRIDGGVILVDRSLRPVFLNARASRIVAESDGLTVEAKSLAAATPLATRELREAMAALMRDDAADGRQLRLARPSRRWPLLLTLYPIRQFGLVLPGVAPPRVAIFISEPDAPPAIDRNAVADAFRLTRRECEIVMLLADGYDLDTIALQLGLAQGTARNHLKQVFAKTGARSQAALVALLRGFSGPLQ
jgi:DNA-binding CsgD family transcriptional regulator/PAS domain-containing protein